MDGVKHFRLEDVTKPGPPGGAVGMIYGSFLIGDGSNPAAPRVTVSRQEPGATVAPHTHGSDYVEIILEGTQKVGKMWHRPGDCRLVKAGTGYGPLIAGPQGCLILVIFANAETSGAKWLPKENPARKYWMTDPDE